MPLSGGASDKAGNRYELIWTVRCMMRALKGEAVSIYLEPPGSEGEGIEFSVTTPSGTEYHQVKRQLTGRGVWSLSELNRRGVLAHFYQRLGGPSASCVFTSSHAAHPLDELACRARQSGSFEEFVQKFVDSSDWAQHFNRLHTLWDSPSKEDSYRRLRRIHVRTISERDLRESVEFVLESLLARNPSNALSALIDFAFEQVHQRLTSTDIWQFLESRDFTRQTWAQDQDVADVIGELNLTYEASLRPLGIRGKTIPRNEVDQILEIFGGDQMGNTVLVSGKAGVGKTSVISQTLARIEDRDWPMLALRVDRLEVSVTPTQLGQSIGLPASPVSVLAALAEGRDCLLVVDQMDAVSLASGRNPEFFDCIGAMLQQAQRIPNMKVLTACRKFDIENDHRLRDLIGDGGIASEVPVVQFNESTVRDLVEDLGLAASRLTAKQVELLSLPIHLKLLAESVSENPDESLGFQTATDLYNRFWEYKRAIMGSQGISLVQMQRIVNLMTDRIAERQVLFVPAALLDEYADTVSVMVSENILVRDGQRVSLFHEGFFDYIFARRFLSEDSDLVSYILDQEQSLFIRSQVRQVLLHQRDLSSQDFSRNLEAVLNHASVRAHLKTISLSLIRSFNDPTEEEWGVLKPLLDTDLSEHLMAAMHGSVAWFDLLDRIGTVRQWLESEDVRVVNRIMWLLHPIQNERASRIAELLSPFVGSSESWNGRLTSLYLRSNFGASSEYFDFALRLVDAGALDELLDPANYEDYVWQPLKNLVESEPVWVCKLIASYLQRSCVFVRKSGRSNPFPPKYNAPRSGQEVITAAANAKPQEFVELLLSFLTIIVEANADKGYGPPWGDRIWGYGGSGKYPGLDDTFFMGIESAMRWVAINKPDEFRVYAGNLRESEYLTFQYLLVRSYAADGQQYADEAIGYVLEDFAKKLEIDYRSNSSGSPIQQLLIEVTPYCSDANLALMEQCILDYYPEWEQGAGGRKTRGASQLQLLESIESSRLTEKAFRMLQELRRKFGNKVPLDPPGIEGGFVGPPIPESSAGKMNDNEWLGAIQRYSSDSPRIEPGKLLVGGAHQLSQILERQTREGPERFAKLIHGIPDEANLAYFEAILRGITEADIDMETVVDACLRCHRIPSRPSGRWITQPLARITDFPLPDEALEMVAWYATKDPDPDPVQVSSNVTYSQSGQEFERYEPLSVGINTVRGTAAGSAARLIFQDERYLTFFRPHLKKMVNDPSDAVLSCVVEPLLGVLRYDRDLAVELFLELCTTKDGADAGHLAVLPQWLRKCVTLVRRAFKRAPIQFKQNLDERLLTTNYAEMFLKYATQTHFRQLEPVLSRMLESDIEEVATVGARWVCYASLTVEEALPLARRSISGKEAHRRGAATVYSANIKISAHRSASEEMLARLFSDPDAEVRREAARCFYDFQGRELQDCQNLARGFICSPSFESRHNPLIDALEKTTADIPDIVLMACARVFDLAGEDTSDIITATAAKLIVRVYSRTADPSLRSRCLDIIDRMTLLRAYGLDTVTDEYDRQQ